MMHAFGTRSTRWHVPIWTEKAVYTDAGPASSDIANPRLARGEAMRSADRGSFVHWPQEPASQVPLSGEETVVPVDKSGEPLSVWLWWHCFY